MDQLNRMKKLFYTALLFFTCSQLVYASDTLAVEKRKILSVKSNMAILLLQGFSLQTEFVINKRTGLWAETAHHCEEHSAFNSALKETNFLIGLNHYSLFKSTENVKPQNGTYFGPYLKYRQGYYCGANESEYASMFIGMQAGIQSISKQNIVFNMGIGYGVGYFIKKAELTYSSFFERYHLPLLDFRATIAIGYMF